eukprot:3970535-Amphidinium_carterae.1
MAPMPRKPCGVTPAVSSPSCSSAALAKRTQLSNSSLATSPHRLRMADCTSRRTNSPRCE